ncbi:hypothetical protein FYK55_03345 [Roseiconus nitratireducens]|uniref:Mur ligase C-terminal domain-containing protein n=1 Tax=Roseiconus nitratireducens TaxID=2605748 RepID=A0A5M6DEI0_9BACT|nr:hypothetical protein [Roseiconus nitratireducens]KAA5545961.1 hypothetical protein FYK55_03345 [Roseiconus nitratireducens]
MRHALDAAANVSLRTHLPDQVPQDPTIGQPLSRGPQPIPVTSVSVEQGFASASDHSCLEDACLDDQAPVYLSSVLGNAKFFGGTDLVWTQAAPSASECTTGDVVVFRIGTDDPSETIAQALARGASGILTEQILPCPLPQCVVGSADRALAEIASHVCLRPDRKLLTIGVVGNSGKTSTCLLTASLSAAAGFRTAYQCDLGSSDGVVESTAADRVPAGADLIYWLEEARDCMSELAVIEVSERAARDGCYDAMQFDVLIVAGRSELADDFGPSGLQCMLDRLTPSGVVIAPEQDAKTRRAIEQTEAKHLFYGTQTSSEFGAVVLDQSGGMSTLMLSAGDTTALMETPLCGEAMAANIGAAMTLGSLLGTSLHKIAGYLSKLRSIPGRGQRLVDFGRSTVVLETGGAVDRVRQALQTAKATGVGGRIWCVLAVGQTMSNETLAQYGRCIERHAHQCVVTSRPGGSNAFLQSTHQLLDGVKHCAAIRMVADPTDAISWVLRQSGPRDTVVIITNAPAGSPQQGRLELQQVERLVDSVRESMEVAEDAAAEDTPEGTKVTLKLFK